LPFFRVLGPKKGTFFGSGRFFSRIEVIFFFTPGQNSAANTGKFAKFLAERQTRPKSPVFDFPAPLARGQ
jgi:hypothetical protein